MITSGKMVNSQKANVECFGLPGKAFEGVVKLIESDCHCNNAIETAQKAAKQASEIAKERSSLRCGPIRSARYGRAHHEY